MIPVNLHAKFIALNAIPWKAVTDLFLALFSATISVTGHRKRQIQLYRRQTNTVSFSKFILKIFVQPTTIFDAWSSSQVLYESLGRSGNAGVGAEDQHSLIVPELC